MCFDKLCKLVPIFLISKFFVFTDEKLKLNWHKRENIVRKIIKKWMDSKNWINKHDRVPSYILSAVLYHIYMLCLSYLRWSCFGIHTRGYSCSIRLCIRIFFRLNLLHFKRWYINSQKLHSLNNILCQNAFLVMNLQNGL